MNISYRLFSRIFLIKEKVVKKTSTLFSFILILFAFSSAAEASCGSANCSLITGSQSSLAGEGRFVVDLSFRYIPQDKKKRGSDSTNEVLVPKVDFENRDLELDHHKEFRTINKLAQLDVSYGVTEKLTISLNLPFFNDRLHEHIDRIELGDPGMFNNVDGTSGFGDITLLAKYSLWQTTKHQFIGGAGVKFASGEFKLKDSDGTINEPTLMPGTGSNDIIVSGLYLYSLIPGRVQLFGSGSHRFTTENPLDYEFGDTTFLDAGVSYVLNKKVTLSGQINTRIARRDHFINLRVPSTGGEFINLTPGVSLAASQNLSFYSHVQIPIYQRVNEVNLVPRYGLLVGASYGF
ncbi:MAG: transporter [Nitrospinaceae bacterium]